MADHDKRVDAYIAKAAPFARPVLTHIRKLVHRAVPGVEETMKWSFPHFDHHGIMCAMAAFKEHCTFGFWKASLLSDPQKLFRGKSKEAMGHFGRITSIGDLPPDIVFTAYIREAARLNAEGIKLPARTKPPRKALHVPPALAAALRKNKKALATFEGFSYSQKKEYLDWIAEAKTDETRKRRLITAVAWMAEGKPRNWKYVRK